MKNLFNKKLATAMILLLVLLVGVALAKPMWAKPLSSTPENQKISTTNKLANKHDNTAQPEAAGAISKNETVYAKIKANGAVKDTTVVNWFHFDGAVPAQLNDPVKLGQVKALNGSFTVQSSPTGVSLKDFEPGKQDIFYSGRTDKALPVKTEIQYYLDGQAIKSEELPGKSGEVKIVIDLANQMHSQEAITYNNGDQMASSSKEIYTPLMTMISLELPIEQFSNVEAPEGLVTVVGQTMKVNWMLFPYPDAQAVLNMQAENFQLGSIQMVVQPKMPPLPDIDAQKSKLEEMHQGLGEVDKALQEAENGSAQLASGQTKIKNGIVRIQDGTGKLILLNQAEEKIAAGALQINNGLLQAVQPYADNPTAANLVKPLLAALQKQQELLKSMVEGGEINGQKVPAMSTNSSALQMAQTALGQLAEGSDKSSAGAQQLHEGIGQIRAQGINKMQSGVTNSLNELNIGLGQKKIMEAKVNSFDSFLGKDSDVKGSVQFIIQTDELN